MPRVHSFARAVQAFNRCLAEHFPLRSYRDSLGRSRTSGRAARDRAQDVLQALLQLQPRQRRRCVRQGYEGLARLMHRSRSTAYRGVFDLRRAGLVLVTPGGGKTYNEADQLVNNANGYQVPDELLGHEERRPRQPRQQSAAAGRRSDLPITPGERLAQERLDNYRGRAGP